LKLINTLIGVQFNSLLAFSLEKVSDLVILINFKELIGALLPSKSPIKAIDFAIQ